MSERPKQSIYAKPEDRILIDYLAEREIRKATDQLTVIVREACKARGIDAEAVLARERGAVPAPPPVRDAGVLGGAQESGMLVSVAG